MHNLIETYKRNIIEQCSPSENVQIVFNSDWNKLNPNEIKYILIADNPGQIEKEKSRYLVGPAGLSTRVYFERAFVSNFKKEVLVLNKTPIYSNTTSQLSTVLKDLLEKSLSLTVQLIKDLVNLLNVPVIIMGYSGGLTKYNDEKKLKLNSNLLNVFFQEFLNSMKTKDFKIISHFSRDSFYKSNITIEDYENNPKELLLAQTRENDQFLRNAHPEFFD